MSENTSRSILVSDSTYNLLLQRLTSHTDTMDMIISGMLRDTNPSALSDLTNRAFGVISDGLNTTSLQNPRNADIMFSSISSIEFYLSSKLVSHEQNVTWNGAIRSVLRHLVMGRQAMDKTEPDILLYFIKQVVPGLNVKIVEDTCPKGWYPLNEPNDGKIVCFQGVSSYQAWRAIRSLTESANQESHLTINFQWSDNPRAAYPSSKGRIQACGHGTWKADALQFMDV